MQRASEMVLVTGATGLVGGAVLTRMLRVDAGLHAAVLVRDLRRWSATASRLGIRADRVTPVLGDLRSPGCGLDRDARLWLRHRVTAVVHAAADIMFAHPLAEARATNVAGVRHLVELVSDWPWARRIAHVSTAYVAGRRGGRILETDAPHPGPWVNPYEQTKAEGEALIRATDREWVILRSGYIACDTPAGQVSQFNAVHLALRYLHEGRTPVIPGSAHTAIDVVTTDYVASGIATLARHRDATGRTFHLCAGQSAMPLGELLDLCWRVWGEDAQWRAAGVRPPRIVGALMYRLLSALFATGDSPTARAARAVSHFVPHLALAQRFDTSQADAMLGFAAPPVRAYWPRMLRDLKQAGWGREPAGVAA